MSSKTSSNHNRVNSHHHPSHGHAKKISGSSHHLPAPHPHHQQHQAPHHQPQHSQHPPGGVRSVRPMHPAETVRGGAEEKMRMAGSSRPHREEKVSFFFYIIVFFS